MRSVELVAGVRSSVLGFGCAPVLGAVGARVAERAFGVALDCGVTHFDVARSYGYGEAEAFLGRFLKGRRDEVVIASKFGIRATWKAGLLRPLKPMVRMLRQRRGGSGASGASEVTGGARRDPFHERVALDPAAMRKSLEASLRALRTDHLDVFFVHEPPDTLVDMDGLAAMAVALKDEGKIRAWGLAYDFRSHELHSASLHRFDVLQFDLSPGSAHYGESVSRRGGETNVFFSPFRGSPGVVPAEVLRRMWMDFPRSVVLCSMFTPEHIRSNARTADF